MVSFSGALIKKCQGKRTRTRPQYKVAHFPRMFSRSGRSKEHAAFPLPKPALSLLAAPSPAISPPALAKFSASISRNEVKAPHSSYSTPVYLYYPFLIICWESRVHHVVFFNAERLFGRRSTSSEMHQFSCGDDRMSSECLCARLKEGACFLVRYPIKKI